ERVDQIPGLEISDVEAQLHDDLHLAVTVPDPDPVRFTVVLPGGSCSHVPDARRRECAVVAGLRTTRVSRSAEIICPDEMLPEYFQAPPGQEIPGFVSGPSMCRISPAGAVPRLRSDVPAVVTTSDCRSTPTRRQSTDWSVIVHVA